MSADAARQALPSQERVEEYVAGALRVLASDLPAPSPLWKSWAFDLADQVFALAALREQPSPDAVVGVGESGYTFADGSTPRCTCTRFSDLPEGTIIADLTCPVHGVDGTDPGDVLPVEPASPNAALIGALEKIASCESHHADDVVAVARDALTAARAGETTA